MCYTGECVKGCGVCGAYMSPAMSWQDCGQRFYCPFCGKLTEGQNKSDVHFFSFYCVIESIDTVFSLSCYFSTMAVISAYKQRATS